MAERLCGRRRQDHLKVIFYHVAARFLAEAVWASSSDCSRRHQRLLMLCVKGCGCFEVVVDVEGFAATTSWMLVAVFCFRCY